MSNGDVTWRQHFVSQHSRVTYAVQADDHVESACRDWSEFRSVPIAESLQLLQPCRSVKQACEAYPALQ